MHFLNPFTEVYNVCNTPGGGGGGGEYGYFDVFMVIYIKYHTKT